MTEPSGISGKFPVTSDILVRAREALDARGHPIMDGHGHVRPRIDGQRARCGGPRICKKCQAEAANMADPWQLVADLAAEVEKLRAEVQRQREGDWAKLSRTLHNAETERDRLHAEYIAFTAALDYGDNLTEPAAELAYLIDPILEAFTDARDHAECPVMCELCGDTLADTDCPDCYGSGSTASGDECQGCEGARKIHVGCVGVSHRDLMKNLADLTEERDEQLAAIAEWQRSALIVITAANQFVMDCVTGDGNHVTIAKALIDSGFDGRNER